MLAYMLALAQNSQTRLNTKPIGWFALVAHTLEFTRHPQKATFSARESITIPFTL